MDVLSNMGSRRYLRSSEVLCVSVDETQVLKEDLKLCVMTD